MHKESRPYPLSNGAEILIGTVRSRVVEAAMLVDYPFLRDAQQFRVFFFWDDVVYLATPTACMYCMHAG